MSVCRRPWPVIQLQLQLKKSASRLSPEKRNTLRFRFEIKVQYCVHREWRRIRIAVRERETHTSLRT